MNLFRKISSRNVKRALMVVFLLVVVFNLGHLRTSAQISPNIGSNVTGTDYTTKQPASYSSQPALSASDLNDITFATNANFGTYFTSGDDVRASLSTSNFMGGGLNVGMMSGAFATYGSYLKSTNMTTADLYVTGLAGYVVSKNMSQISATEFAGIVANNTIFNNLNIDYSSPQNQSNPNLIALHDAIYNSTLSVLNDPDCLKKMQDAHVVTAVLSAKAADNYVPLTPCVKRVTDNTSSAFVNYYSKTTTDPAKLAVQLQNLKNVQSGNANAIAGAPGKPEEIFCLRWSQGLSIPGCIAIGSYIILYLSSWVLWVAALLFDFTINWSLALHDVFSMFPAIQYGWETFRNFVNLFFILILVYIAIATILRIESYGYKKLLGRLVLAAFLINFSMFFTEIIIDVSNMTAIVFYKQILADAKSVSGNTAATQTNPAAGAAIDAANSAAASSNNYISLGIMNALQLQAIWGVAVGNEGGDGGLGNGKNASNDPAVNAGNKIAAGGGAAGVLNPWTMTLVGLGGSVFILFLSFIFIAAAGMFLLRTVVLIALVILSPLAYAARILPKTQEYSDKWWKKLTSNALFAPVYMMMMYITLQMLWSGSAKINGGLLSLFANQNTGGIQVVMFFMLICFMLIACLMIASSLGVMGAKTFEGWGKSARTWGKNFAINRATSPVSKLADMTSRSTTLGKLATSDNALGRFIGSRTLQMSDKLAESKLGGSSSYRGRGKAGQKVVESRAKLAETAIKKRPGETDVEYYNRTGYRGGILERKKGETDAEYSTRMNKDTRSIGFTMPGYKDGEDMKRAVSRAYNIGEDGTDAHNPQLKSFFFKGRGTKLAALSRMEELEKKSKEKESPVIKQLEKVVEKLYKEEERDPTTGVVTKPRSGSLIDLPGVFKNPALQIDALTVAGTVTKDNVVAKSMEMKSLIEREHAILKTEKDNLRTAVETAKSDADAIHATAASPEEKLAAHNNWQRQLGSLQTLQQDIDELDKHKASLNADISKMDELNVAKAQLEAVSGIKLTAPTP